MGLSFHIFFPFCSSDLQITAYKCFAANNTVNAKLKTRSCVKLADRSSELSETDLTSLVGQKNSDRMRKQLLNSVIAKYRGLSVSRSSII